MREGNGLPKVLIVEDSESTATLLSERLAELGYEPFVAFNGKTALELFLEHEPDVAAIDYHLPDLKGDELLHRFRKVSPDCICIMMTSDTRSDLTIPWIKAGAAAYLRKPFEPEYLIELCERARRDKEVQLVQQLLEERTSALHDSQARCSELLDNLPVGVYQTNMDGSLIECNKACFEMARCPQDGREFFIAKNTLQAYVNPEDAKEFRRRLLKDGRVDFFEAEVKRFDGTTCWLSESARLKKDDNGEPISVSGVLIEITDRKKVEDRLRVASEKNKAILEALPDFVFHMSADCTYIDGYANDESKLLVPPEQFIGKSCDEVLPDYLCKLNKDCIAKTLKTGRVQSFTYDLDMNGTKRYYEARMVPFNRKEIIVVVRDVTEETKIEKHLRQVQKEESVGRIASGVAHDLNNMLAPILSYSELLLDVCNLNEQGQEYANEVRNGALHARELVRQLLAFSRKQELNYSDLELSDAVHKFSGLLKRSIPEGVKLDFDNVIEVCVISADLRQIEQVLMNLVVNAAQAMPNGGTITISTDETLISVEAAYTTFGLESGRYVILAVSDTGVGMDEDTVKHIFEPFFTTKGDDGVGLGLATAYGIIKQHGGTIMVDSKLGKGSKFEVYLPVKDS